MTSHNKETNGRSPYGRPGFLWAGGFVSLLVLLLVVVLIVNSGRDDRGIAPAPNGTTAATPSSAPTRDVGPTTVPTAPPAGVTWQLYHTVALPSSPQFGPFNTTASTATGYAHTPNGALIAAIQIPMRKLLAPNWQEVVNTQILPGPGRDIFIKNRKKITDPEPSPGELGQVAGFRFVNYSDSVATIQIATRFVSDGYQIATVSLQWSNNDWKLILQPDGGDSPTAQSSRDLSGYTEWGGV